MFYCYNNWHNVLLPKKTPNGLVLIVKQALRLDEGLVCMKGGVYERVVCKVGLVCTMGWCVQGGGVYEGVVRKEWGWCV